MGVLLLVPFFLGRFGLMALLDRGALIRAAHFPPMEGGERAAYWVYQFSTAALLLGLPAAYALNRYRFKGKELIKSLFLSPVLIPVIVLGFVMLRYVVNRFKLPAMPSLLIGHTILSSPYVMRVVTSSLANFDFSMEEAARILGAGNVYTFFHILLPNIKSGIVSACIMAIINSFNNVSLSAFLTSAGVSMLPIEMMAYVEYHFDPTIAALATLLMVITLGVMLVIEKTLGLKSVV